jgi:hypothetical protein
MRYSQACPDDEKAAHHKLHSKNTLSTDKGSVTVITEVGPCRPNAASRRLVDRLALAADAPGAFRLQIREFD